MVILPESQRAFDYGVKLLKDHGKCVIVSFPDNGFHFSAKDVVFRDISIIGSLVGTNKTLNEMLEFAAGKSNPCEIPSETNAKVAIHFNLQRACLHFCTIFAIYMLRGFCVHWLIFLV